MSYTPNNLTVFNAAYASALAAMNVSSRPFIPYQQSTQYTHLAQVAGAFAKQFDTTWTSTRVPTELDLLLLTEAIASIWEDVPPPTLDNRSLVPGTYVAVVNSVLAMLSAASAYWASQGIVSPPAAQNPPETALDLYVNPLTGSDLNNGLTAGTALKTLAAAALLVTGAGILPRSAISVHLLADQLDSTDSFNPSGLQTPGSPVNQGAGNLAVSLIGQRTTLSSLTMTANATAPDMTVGPGGEPTKVYVTGFDFSPYVGRQIEIINDTNGGATNGALATIVKAPALGVAWLSPIANPDYFFPFDEFTQPTSGSTFRIFSVTQFAPPASGVFFGISQYQMYNLDFLPANEDNFQLANVLFIACRFQRVICATYEGNLGGHLDYQSCCLQFPTPDEGVAPNQWEQIGGHCRWINCGIIDVNMQPREGSATSLFWFSVFMRSNICVSSGGSDLRTAPVSTAITWWNGFFDWVGPIQDFFGNNTDGAAISISHGAKATLGAAPTQFGLNSYLYGSSGNADTTGVAVHAGGSLIVSPTMTAEAAPDNPPFPVPPFTPSSLKLTGTLGQIQIDGEDKQIAFSTLKSVLTGDTAPGAGNYVTCKTWTVWENSSFLRNAVSLKSGASIVDAVTY